MTGIERKQKTVGFRRIFDIRRLLMAVAMAACVVNAAQAASPNLAQAAVAPKADSMISGDVVTVGDVFSGVTHDAGYVLAPAPSYGKALTLGAYDLQRVSDAFNLGWYPKTWHEQVVIRRDAHEIDGVAIRDAVRGKVEAGLSSRKVEVRLDTRDMSIAVPRAVPATVSVSDLRYDAAKGTFTATLTAPAGAARPTVRRSVSGRVFTLVSVPVLKTARMPGDTIRAGDISYVDTRGDDLAASTITDPARLIGMTPRRALAALKPVSASDVIQPPLVKRGQTVILQLQNGQMFLTAQGRALEDGVKGDTVRVANTASNQVVQGTVTGLKTVTVAPPARARVPAGG